MNSYTKGPWAVQKAEDCMGRKLDDMVGWVVTAQDHDLWISTGPTWDPEHAEESEANARLIAAAPDLLEALMAANAELEMWRAGFPNHSDSEEVAVMIDEEISKAIGESA